MEETLSNDTVCLPLGIKCMEVSIKEADDVVKEFIKKNPWIFNFTSAPSWKFPHINIEKLDVLNVMETYRTRSIYGEKQYLELTEILIDRLYFSLLAMYQFLTCSEVSAPLVHVGQGDCQPSPVKMPWDTTEKTVKSNGDPKRQFQTANIGDILRRIHTKLLSMDIIPTSHEGYGDTKLERPLSKKGKSWKGSSLQKRYSQVLVQTDFSGLEGCESCYLSQNILKFLAEIVASCFKTFVGDQSQITKFRQGEKDAPWMYSQRAMVIKWCETLESDCQVMMEKAGEIVEQNKTYKSELESSQKKSTRESAVNEFVIEDVKMKLKACEEELQSERKCLRKLLKQKDTATNKANQVEGLLQKKIEEVNSQELEKGNLQKEIKHLRALHNQLHTVHNSTLTELEGARKELEKVTEERNGFSKRLTDLEVQVNLKDNEILKNLKKLMEKIQNYESEKLELRKSLAQMKQQLEASKKAEETLEKAEESHRNEVCQLSESLENAKSQIELLTLYPDLNGPINPPTGDLQNPLHAMEMQVKSNELRMQVLKSQTDRLHLTLGKLRFHMQSK